ncbi:MAG: DUF805 domain-containing protein [Candidatus Nanopelagicales bacterium]
MTMTFGQAVKHVFSNYATFRGRASRSEFWWFYLFNVIVTFVLSIPYYIGLAQSAGTMTTDPVTGEMTGGSLSGLAVFGIILLVGWLLITFIPIISVSVRRLHDGDRTGWWWWLYLLCFIGPIILLIFYILPGTPGPNRYGEGPAQPA